MTESDLGEGKLTVAAGPSVDRRILCPVLIGREAELDQLDALLRESLAGHGRTVLVSGEAGVGKTALIRAFIQRARAAGSRVLSGDCTEIEARRSLGPFMDIVRSANRAASLPVATADGTADRTDRYRLLSAFVGVFADLANARPTMILVEDLHWADEASLELFPHLARKLRDVPLLLVGTYRTDELHRRHPFRTVLADMSRTRVATDVELRRLNESEVADFLREAMNLGRPPTPAFRQAIFQTCEGNPLFMEEVLRALVQRGEVEYREGSWRRTKEVADIAIPETLRDAVLERFRALSSDAQDALRHAAVIGQRFDFDLLQQVTRSQEATLLGSIRAAIEAQLVLEIAQAEGSDHYVFRHALTRESVLLELLQRERRRMHATVGEAIESRAGDDPAPHAEELAYHFDEGGDQRRAFRYHDLAACEAYRLFGFARAARHLERAVDLAEPGEPLLGDLQLRLADAAFLSADPRRALHAALAARAWFDGAGDPRGAGAALSAVALYRWLLGDTRAARDAAEDAIRLLEPLGKSPQLAGAYAAAALVAWLDNDFSAAMERARKAAEMARETKALSSEVDALITLGAVESTLGQSKGIARLREAIDLASAHGMVHETQRGLTNLGSALRKTRSLAEGRRVYEELFVYARRLDYRSELIIIDEAACALDDGDWDAVLKLAQEATEESAWTPGFQAMKAVVWAGREGPKRALPLLDGPRRRLRDAALGHKVAGVSHLVRAALLAGDAAAALQLFDLLHGDVLRTTYPEIDEAAVSALVSARSLQDKPAFDRVIEVALAGQIGAPRPTADARRALARAELAANRRDLHTAVALLAQSAEMFGQAPLAFAETLARRRRIELLVKRDGPGDLESAQEELSAILPYWRKAKAVWYLRELERWAVEHGLAFPTAERPQTSPKPERRPLLTAREREVARLVAQGLSNKEISQKLVISERTAEGHVERILGKLGFRSRAQIASWQAGGDPTPKPS